MSSEAFEIGVKRNRIANMAKSSKKNRTEQSKHLVDQTYMEALTRLRNVVAEEYADGGWLPSGRDMCLRLGVNRITYTKALSRLIDERVAQNYPRKGTYIKPNFFRIRKVGVIIGNGEDSPFLAVPNLLMHVISEFQNNNISIQFIQATHPESLLKKAVFHCVSGLLWLYSQPSALAVADQLSAENHMPLMLVRFFDPKQDEDIASISTPLISRDYQEFGKQRARSLIKRGHRQIAYAGSYWFAQYTGFNDELNAAGIDFGKSNCFESENDIRQRMPEFIRTKKITALLSEGNFLDNVFMTVNTLSGNLQPELYVRHLNELALYHQYPEVKSIHVEYMEATDLGIAAAQAMAAHVMHGTPLKSQSIPPRYRIRKLDQSVK